MAIQTATSLREIGATIALDDFGTGYSSFSHLRRLPIDVMKLDMSIVKDIDSDRTAAAIATSVTSMAQELGMRVIAEGVETEEQLEALRQRGCDEYQGFFFSKALAGGRGDRAAPEGEGRPQDATAQAGGVGRGGMATDWHRLDAD